MHSLRSFVNKQQTVQLQVWIYYRVQDNVGFLSAFKRNGITCWHLGSKSCGALEE